MNLTQAEQFRQQKRAEGATSDGCTLAPELGTPCCEMHDYLRRYRPNGITALEADNLLFQCILKKGKEKGAIRAAGYFALACVYWIFIRIANVFEFYS